MSYETRPNSGSLFKNEGARKRENGPDYSGKCLVGGEEYYFDGWIKVAESGRKWMSFSFKPASEAKTDTRTHAERKKAPKLAEMEDDIPF